MILTKEEKEIESLYESGKISTKKPSREKLATILKECPVRGWAMPRDKQLDLRKAVDLGIKSAKAG